ncbi:MAG: hypothetical protein AAFO82_18940 [Bacteroidota bacterium]
MKIFIFTISSVCIFFISCEKLGPRPVGGFSFERVAHQSDLMTDGFYYGNSYFDFSGREIYEFLVLYDNGIGRQLDFDILDNLEQVIDRATVSENRTGWGIFRIEEDSIFYEHWLSGMGGDNVLRRSGIVLSDTTFLFTKQQIVSARGVTDNEEVVEQLFTFRQYSPKPDSTNNFIN